MVSPDVLAAVGVPIVITIGGWVFYIDRAVVRVETKQDASDKRFEEIRESLVSVNSKLDQLFVPR
jgi:hypothetical protein